MFLLLVVVSVLDLPGAAHGVIEVAILNDSRRDGHHAGSHRIEQINQSRRGP